VSAMDGILHDHRCHLGEGAAYDPGTGTAWWFDILERRLFEARDVTGSPTVRVHDLPGTASALAVVDDGRLLVSAEDGLHLRDRGDGRTRLLHPNPSGPARMRANDGRAHPCGTFWFSTMALDKRAGGAAIHALHRGRVTTLFPGLTIPNAICFSPDGATGYFADTVAHALHRVALDPATGLPIGPAAVIHRHEGGGGLDGAVTDAEGLLWIARWGGACVDAFTPEGERVRSVAVPASQASCPVFVGRNLDRMLVTSATEGQDEAARAADPHGGKTFLVDPGARGRPEARVRLDGA
jgi:sugar lactone lactonase